MMQTAALAFPSPAGGRIKILDEISIAVGDVPVARIAQIIENEVAGIYSKDKRELPSWQEEALLFQYLHQGRLDSEETGSQ